MGFKIDNLYIDKNVTIDRLFEENEEKIFVRFFFIDIEKSSFIDKDKNRLSEGILENLLKGFYKLEETLLLKEIKNEFCEILINIDIKDRYNSSELDRTLYRSTNFMANTLLKIGALSISYSIQSEASNKQLYVFRQHIEEYIPIGEKELSVLKSSNSIRPLKNDAFYSSTVLCKKRGIYHPLSLIEKITRGRFHNYEDHCFVQLNASTAPKFYPGLAWQKSQEWDFKEVQRFKDGISEEDFKNFKSNNIIWGEVSSKYLGKTIKRVLIIANALEGLCPLREAECRAIISAISYAKRESLPIDWITISSGAAIDMQSGTENLDWTADVLKEIILFTEEGGEINVVVPSINVGAQSYWNAEATMLMHCRGLLIMTSEGSMLLTGKKALDFSGSASAENNVLIGGAFGIMADNGQAQIVTEGLHDALKKLMLFHSYTKIKQVPVKWAEKGRRYTDLEYKDPLNPNMKTVGDIFSQKLNADKKKPFDMRQVIEAVKDEDARFLERFALMSGAHNTIFGHTRTLGRAVGLIGIYSCPEERMDLVPNNASRSLTSGTLFPQSSKKMARAIRSCSGVVPLVILANLSGFDGSPDSLRNLQLEYGAEIGRAIVDFKGPIIFVVVSRYHGGAYVVFSKRLNPNLHALAFEGTFASVIGGAPAAAVVFAGQVKKEMLKDPLVKQWEEDLKVGKISKDEKASKEEKLLLEYQGKWAEKFEKIHTVERAKQVDSIDEIIKPETLREKIEIILDRYNQ